MHESALEMGDPSAWHLVPCAGASRITWRLSTSYCPYCQHGKATVALAFRSHDFHESLPEVSLLSWSRVRACVYGGRLTVVLQTQRRIIHGGIEPWSNLAQREQEFGSGPKRTCSTVARCTVCVRNGKVKSRCWSYKTRTRYLYGLLAML